MYEVSGMVRHVVFGLFSNITDCAHAGEADILREPKIWCLNGLGFQNSFFCFGTVRRTNTCRGSFTKSVLEQLRKPNCFTQAKRSEKPTVLERFLGFFVLEQFAQPTRRRTALQKSGLEQLVYSLVYSFQCSQTVFQPW